MNVQNYPASKLNKNNKHIDTTKYIPTPYKKVAKAQESAFLKFMLDQMHKTTGSKPKGSAGTIYRSLLNQERADLIAEQNKGLGIQNVILDQIYPKRLRNPITYNAFLMRNKNSARKMFNSNNNIKMNHEQNSQDHTLKKSITNRYKEIANE